MDLRTELGDGQARAVPDRPGRPAADVRRRNLAHAEESRRLRSSRHVDDHGQRGRTPGHVAHAQARGREACRRDPTARRLGGMADDTERRSGAGEAAAIPGRRNDGRAGGRPVGLESLFKTPL